MILLKVDHQRLRLTRDLSRWLRGDRVVAAFLEGDTVVLKKVAAVPASAYASRSRGPSLRAINAEVHRARRAAR